MIEMDNRIKLEHCEHRKLYKIIARNLLIGVWDKDSQRFYGIRTKFNQRFIDGEYHWDAPAFATCQPIEMIGELPPEIEMYIAGGNNKPLFNWLEEQEKIHASWRQEKSNIIRDVLEKRRKQRENK